MQNEREWALSPDWAEDPETQDYRSHLRDRLRLRLDRLEALARQDSLEKIRFVAGEIAALREILTETTNDARTEREPEE